jgi:ribose transport system permease protein
MTKEARRRSPLGHAVAREVGLVLVTLLLVAAVALYVAIYAATQQRLPGAFELITTVNNTLPLIFAALAQTLVVMTRGLDLSVGGMVDLTNALAAVYLGQSPGRTLGVALAILLTGALLGFLNGALVAWGRLQPILVTLATLSIFQGLAIWVLPQPGGSVPEFFSRWLANTSYPTGLLYTLGAALAWLAFRRTPLGIALLAIGNDENAAAAHGISPLRTKLAAYTLAGALSALAGLFLAATATAGDATTGNGYTLTSIVAVVLGGVSLFGGRGSAIGAILGAYVITMIVNILFFAHIDPLYQSFYEGLFLVIAVVLAEGVGRLIRRRKPA